MEFEDTNVQNAPTSMDRFRRMNDNITLRGVETNLKANSSLLAATKNVRPSLRSSSAKELPSPILRYNSPASVSIVNDARDDNISCSSSMSIEQYDDAPRRLNMSKTDSFSVNKVMSQGSFLSETPADLDLKRNDDAFENIADMIIDHISPSVVEGNTHYALSKDDVARLESLVPMSVRLRFVSALRYRANSQSPSLGKADESSSFFVRECMRLGLGEEVKENVLLGGGEKMSDGTTHVMLEANNPQPPEYVNSNDFTPPTPSNPDFVDLSVPSDMSWMGQTNLTSEQMQVIIAAQDSSPKKDGVVIQNQGNTGFAQTHNVSLPDDMKWMIYAGLTPEQMQVTLNAMNVMKEDAILLAKSTADCEVERGDELEHGLGRQAMSTLKGKSALLNDQNRFQTHTIQVPEHAWRDGLQDIFSNGISHPYCLLSLGAPLLAAGQVMTRLQFNCTGSPSSLLEVRGNFYSLIAAIVLWAVLNIVSLASFYIHWGRGIIVSFDIILFSLTNLVMHTFSVYAIANTRYNLREKYKIPASKWLAKYEDYVLTTVMMPFVVAQMGRHTGDYGIINYSIFSATGLPPETKLVDAEPHNYLPPGSPILSIT